MYPQVPAGKLAMSGREGHQGTSGGVVTFLAVGGMSRSQRVTPQLVPTICPHSSCIVVRCRAIHATEAVFSAL
jgi:hypothetical protein